MIILFILLVILFIPILFFPSCKQPEQKVDCLLVLGCPTYQNGEMSITQKYRVEKAANVIQKYNIPVCIIAGGKAHNDFSEAEVMANYLKTLIDIEPILEDKSTTTFENMKFTKILCEQNHYKKIGILTSGYHASRAFAMSKKFFDDVVMFKAPYRFTIKKMIREFLSRYQYIYIEIKYKIKANHH